MPLTSIIIPFRQRAGNPVDRHGHLQLFLLSLLGSMRICRRYDFEMIVVDGGSTLPPAPRMFSDRPDGSMPVGVWCHRFFDMKVLRDPSPREIFNKPRLLNLGIEASEGDVLCFIDADAIAGGRFLDTFDRLRREPDLTRLCYRVRYVPAHQADMALGNKRIEDLWARAYQSWDELPRGHEGRGPDPMVDASLNVHADDDPIFGNSQWAIRREVLGDLRHNEDYEGAGFEDFWTIRQLWRREGTRYRAAIETEPGRALLMQLHPREQPDWRTEATLNRNRQRYRES